MKSSRFWRNQGTFCSIFLLLWMVSTSFAGQIIYVDDDASVGGDGTSWANAYKYLQDGLAAAVARIAWVPPLMVCKAESGSNVKDSMFTSVNIG